ncbi:hypothetical protein CJ030_MR3G022815 [Morella rubra]|uniref:Ty3 transposon capsid-like protein domain-containing protein n=1 Tax=Morella rubra TaxID=262757 RepID=A0A6A1W405_9ROSI|nr:hypothetical protein CJ030_MR3G022815 [Morella rubra]
MNHRVLNASLYMEGEALVWFQDFEEFGAFCSWETFTKALLVRFGSSPYDDPMEAMQKLRQKGTVADYKRWFENLSNRLKEVSDRIMLSWFIRGLKDDIRYPIKLLNPSTLQQAFGMAKIQEEYVSSIKCQ